MCACVCTFVFVFAFVFVFIVYLRQNFCVRALDWQGQGLRKPSVSPDGRQLTCNHTP